MRPFILFFCLFLSIHINSIAQDIELVINTSRPSTMLIDGNTMYFTQHLNNVGKLSKIDITETNPSPIDILTSLDLPYGLAMSGDYLFIALTGEGKIIKINTTESNPTPETVVSGLSEPAGLIFHGNTLFFSQLDSGELSKIDINDPNAVVFNASALLMSMPSTLAIKDNYLYIGEIFSGKVSRIDLNVPLPVPEDYITGLHSPNHILFLEDDLFIGELNGGEILRVNTNDPNLIPEVFLPYLYNPTGITYKNGHLYFAEFGANRISKTKLQTTSNNNLIEKEDISIYPNPCSDYLMIDGISEKTEISLFSSNGMLLNKYFIKEDQIIDTSQLATGVYFIRTSEGQSFRFAKSHL